MSDKIYHHSIHFQENNNPYFKLQFVEGLSLLQIAQYLLFDHQVNNKDSIYQNEIDDIRDQIQVLLDNGER